MKPNQQNSTPTTLTRCALALLLSALAFRPSPASAAGPLTPPGTPAPLWKTLQEIEPRTLIASVPCTLSAPGSYYLSNNLTVATGTAILIQASGVTLDLNGCTLGSAASTATGDAISIAGGYRDIVIYNGHIVSGVTDSGGTFSGPGFQNGIAGAGAANVRVHNVSVSGVLNRGIDLALGDSAVVSGCSIKTVGGQGIVAQTVENSAAFGCGSDGIMAYQASNSSGQSPYSGNGLYLVVGINCCGWSVDGVGLLANGASGCYGQSSTSYGISATTANNCLAYSDGTNSYGLYTYNAAACYAQGGTAGIYCSGSALGCYGIGFYGYGVYACAADNCCGYDYSIAATPYAGVCAKVAHNCYGYCLTTASHYGLLAEAASNCEGYGMYSVGVSVYPGTAENCNGFSYYAIGLEAQTAINCLGVSTNSCGVSGRMVNNCYGESCYSDGLQAVNAHNSYGYTHAGYYGLFANCANNCGGFNLGTGSNGYGLYASYSANNCYGYTSRIDATGLYARLAVSCFGQASAVTSYGLTAYIANSSDGSGGTPVFAPFKYNMP